ncbi:iron-binding protein [Aspergillus brasiliensis]|nr:iron-binding protein [Aspergillus brasiliensis]
MFRRLVTVVPRSGVLSPRSVTPAVSGIQQAVRSTVVAPQQQQRRGYHEKDMSTFTLLSIEENTDLPCTVGPLLQPNILAGNVGSMSKSIDVGTGLVGAPACGDVMKLQIRVDKDTNKISDVKFKTFGCGSAIASSSYLTELVRGMTLDEAAKIRNTDIAKELCLPPVKLHCSMLAEDAIKSAISDYYTKNPRAVKTDLSGTGASIPDVQVEVEKTSSATA